MTMIYKPGEVMKKLELKESTFKKYYLAIEKEGYVFQRDSSNRRIFTEEDLKLFELFMEMIRYDGMTIESVAKKIGETKGNDVITEDKKESYDVMSLVETHVNNALQKQANEYITEMKKLSNQIEALKSEQLRESMENRKLLNETLSAVQEIAATQKKSIWSRLFGK